METRNFSAQQRRAMNIVWTGAGDYGFEPPFLAMTASGQPDFYLDLLVGPSPQVVRGRDAPPPLRPLAGGRPPGHAG